MTILRIGVILTLLVFETIAYSADSLYVITAPPGDGAAGANGHIYHITKNQVELAGTIDLGTFLCGMTLDESDGYLYVFGNNNKKGGRGYATRYNLEVGFNYQPMLLPFPPSLNIYLDSAEHSPRIFAWSSKIPGESYILYEVNYKDNDVKLIPPGNEPNRFRCYTQQGPFSSDLRLAVDEMGAITYYLGTQTFPSPYTMPPFMRKEIPESVGIYNWRCFSCDDHVFALSARDEKSDKTFIAVYNVESKHWKSLNIAGAASDIWANRYGFATCSILTANGNQGNPSKDIVLRTYDLSQSWKASLPMAGEVIFFNGEMITLHSEDCIYTGKVIAGNSTITPVVFVKDKALINACAAFQLKD